MTAPTPDPWEVVAGLREEALHLDEAAARLRIRAQHLERMALVGTRRVRSAGTGPVRTGTIITLDLPEENVALVEWDDQPGHERPVEHRRLRPAKSRHPESETPIFPIPAFRGDVP
jgi:hypothetical protein